METVALDARPRLVLGKKVRFLRRNGIVPANVFGHNIQSLALEIEESAMEKALAQAGTNTLITLNVAGAEGTRPVLVRGYQRRPTTGKLLHVDLYQVSMTEAITTEVPVVLVGTAPGVNKGGVLIQNLDAVEIECLPGDLVSAIEVDISGLIDIDDQIEVRDLKVGSAITILTDPETVVAKLEPPAREEMEAEAPAEVAPVAEAAEKEAKEE